MRTWDRLFKPFLMRAPSLPLQQARSFRDGFNSYPLDQAFDVVIANLAHDPMNGPLDLKDDS